MLNVGIICLFMIIEVWGDIEFNSYFDLNDSFDWIFVFMMFE